MEALTPHERRLMACEAAICAWFNVASRGGSRAIRDAFEDEGLKPTEDETACGLDALRYFIDHDESKKAVAERFASDPQYA